MEMFMFCDLVRYELSARGSMNGHDADPLVDAILRLPDDSTATIDLQHAGAIDDAAAAMLATAVRQRQRHGVDFSILVGSELASATLAAVGLTQVVVRRPHDALV